MGKLIHHLPLINLSPLHLPHRSPSIPPHSSSPFPPGSIMGNSRWHHSGRPLRNITTPPACDPRRPFFILCDQ